jgi:hypothetical protein
MDGLARDGPLCARLFDRHRRFFCSIVCRDHRTEWGMQVLDAGSQKSLSKVIVRPYPGTEYECLPLSLKCGIAMLEDVDDLGENSVWMYSK